MTAHLDEVWPTIKAAFTSHDIDITEDTARALSEQVGRELLTRGHVLSWEAHARAVEQHTDAAVRELRAEVNVLREQAAHPLITVPPDTLNAGHAHPAGWGERL